MIVFRLSSAWVIAIVLVIAFCPRLGHFNFARLGHYYLAATDFSPILDHPIGLCYIRLRGIDSMTEDSTSDVPFPAEGNTSEENLPGDSTPSGKSLAELWDNIVRLGLGEPALRIGTGLASIALVLMVVWVMSSFYLKGNVVNPQTAAIAAALPTATPVVEPPNFQPIKKINGITRLAQIRTTLPARPRYEINQYTVQEGDTLFTIAERFGLNPTSLLWGNQATLPEPHWLQPGQVLNILPLDGALYEWHSGDGLNGVATFYNVTPDAIIDWPGNNLNRETLGDFANPNIEPGTLVFIPGGVGVFNTWTLPTVTRDNPAVARTVGPGACGAVYTGSVGDQIFSWPSATNYISGYRFQPEINHFGIDIGGSIGVGIYAADDGVVVYSGWNDYGYGNLIIIDHGNGWQTYYAHLDIVYTSCGESIADGAQIGLMGSTGNSSGPHLHFEMRSELYGRVDPLNFVQ
jgi:murein DD-endopeptidase MepM/ murein hydrolase activator NlpD